MLIAFEGPIAAGKTTLTQLYSSHARGSAILEEFGSNEFLADFYADNKRWALPMQASFLLDRCAQLAAINLSIGLKIADYAFIKNEIFAQMLLQGRELRLFSRLIDSLRQAIPNPDLFIYLDATDEVLLERIAIRGRPFEAHIDKSYLGRLRAVYDLYLGAATERNVIRFDTSALNLESETQMGKLFAAIDAAITDTRTEES
jgi:deoxyguanosine kinase